MFTGAYGINSGKLGDHGNHRNIDRLVGRPKKHKKSTGSLDLVGRPGLPENPVGRPGLGPGPRPQCGPWPYRTGWNR